MMTNPFASTVGLQGVTTPTPAILVNDLSGISTELVTALSNQDAADATAVWAKVQRAALDKLRSLVEGELSKSADFRYISNRSGSITSADQTYPNTLAGAVYRGGLLRAPAAKADELFIASVVVYSATVQDVPTVVKVFSAKGAELFSKAVTVSPGYNSVRVDFGVRETLGPNVLAFVVLDCSGLELETLGDSQCWDTDLTCYSMTSVTLDLAGPYSAGAQTKQDTTCVYVEAVVRRSLVDVIARYADRLGWAYAHVCGSLLMAEKLGSSNVNLFTNTNRNFTEDREAKFMDEAAVLVRPVARDMLKELAHSNQVTDRAERPFDSGYRMTGFV